MSSLHWKTKRSAKTQTAPPCRWYIGSHQQHLSLGHYIINPNKVLLLMVQESCVHQLRLVVYPINCRVSYIPGGAGFQPINSIKGKSLKNTIHLHCLIPLQIDGYFFWSLFERVTFKLSMPKKGHGLNHHLVTWQLKIEILGWVTTNYHKIPEISWHHEVSSCGAQGP